MVLFKFTKKNTNCFAVKKNAQIEKNSVLLKKTTFQKVLHSKYNEIIIIIFFAKRIPVHES